MYHSALLRCGASFTAEALKRRNDNGLSCSTRSYSVTTRSLKKDKRQWQDARFRKCTWMLLDLLLLFDRL